MATGDKLVNLDDLKTFKQYTDTQDENLKSAIGENSKVINDSLLNVVDLMPYVTETGEIGNTGAVADNINYRRSRYIPVSKGTIINYSAYAKTGANILSFYTSMDELTYQSGVAGYGASSGRSGQFPESSSGFPSSGFVRISVAYAKFSSCTITMTSAMKNETDEIKNDILSVNADIDFLKDENDNIPMFGESLIDVVDYASFKQESGAVGTSGEDQVNANYVRSTYIPVKKGAVIQYQSFYCRDSSNILSFYTKADPSTYVSGLVGYGASSGRTGSHTMEFTGFMRICCTAAKVSGIHLIVNPSLRTEITNLSNTDKQINSDLGIVANSFDNIDAKDFMTVTGGVMAENGTFYDYAESSYKRSGFIYVRKDWKIKVVGARAGASYNVISLYSSPSTESYISGVQGQGTVKVNTVYSVPSDGYVALCCTAVDLSSETSQFIVYTALAEKLESINSEENETIAQLVNEGRQKILEYNSDHRCLNFTLITDTHMFREASNFSCKNSVRLFAEMSKYTDFSVHCGDVAESGDMTATGLGLTPNGYVPKALNWEGLGTFIGLVRNTQAPIYICHGNHDVSRYDTDIPGTNAIVEQAWENQCGKLAKDRVVNPVDPYGNYYYVDYDEFKCRVIVVDYFGKNDGTYPTAIQGCSEAAETWLQNTALDLSGKATPVDWTILMFSHARQISSLKTKISEIRKSESPIALIFIHGNDHADDYDNDIYSHSTSTQDDPRYTGSYFNNIGVDKAFVKEWLPSDAGLIGTVDEYCVDVFTVDFNEGKIYETRLGRGNDREYVFSATNTSEANNIVGQE